MKAKREGDSIQLTLTPQEAHVLIWGGPQRLVGRMEQELRTTLVGVEDEQFSDEEYRTLFDDLNGMYERLRADFAIADAVGEERT